jgi:hypothetical protein
MQFQLNTDRHLRGSEDLAARLRAEVEATLDRFASRVTRVEVHLSDLNGGDRGGPDKRCQLEARLAGRAPVSVAHVAPAWDLAIDGALARLAAALEHALGKLDATQRAAPHHGLGADGDLG